MKINNKVKMPLAWAWCVDVYFYALAFPVIQCIVNKQLSVALYAIPSLIVCLLGGFLNLRITEKETMRKLYDNWFLPITVFDASVWIGYFALWLGGIAPDTWYPIAAAIMNVSTVQLSIAVRNELKNRMFPDSSEKTEFENACCILSDLFNAAGCITILLFSIKSFALAKAILLFAVVIDNLLFILIWRHFESGKKNNRMQHT